MKEPGINLNHLDGLFRGSICGPFVNHARYNVRALQCAFGDTGWNYCTSFACLYWGDSESALWLISFSRYHGPAILWPYRHHKIISCPTLTLTTFRKSRLGSLYTLGLPARTTNPSNPVQGCQRSPYRFLDTCTCFPTPISSLHSYPKKSSSFSLKE